MTTSRPEDFARHYSQNGMKFKCQEGLNVRDLRTISRSVYTKDSAGK